MTKFFTLFTLLFLLSTESFSAEQLEGKPAEEAIKGAAVVWYKSDSDLPNYIKFREDFQLSESEVIGWLKAEFESLRNLSVVSLRTYKSITGIKHETFGFAYNDVPLEFLRVVVHSTNGRVNSISGTVAPEINVSNTLALNEGEALSYALDAVDAETYKWEISAEEEWIKLREEDQNYSYSPVGQQVIVARDGNYTSPEFRYAIRFDIRSAKPAGKEEIYVDAQTGEILLRNNLIHTADSNGTAYTGFSGIRPIVTKRKGAQYSLQEDGRKIKTWNLYNTTSEMNRGEFFDADNLWLYTSGNIDQYALDAHWGAEMAYDYFMNSFNRNGIDNMGYEMNVYAHYGEGFENAFWDGESIYIGDGHFNPFSTIDLIGHEITHGLIDYTADLVRQGESGALDESFSDIFGKCIEYYGKPNDFSWGIGQDRGDFIRNMEAPKLQNHPDTYEGVNWYTGTDEEQASHVNSGVLNYWFKLLAEGGNGINDKGKSYSVEGIGMHKAAWIAYETLTAYMTPTSDYEDVYFYSIIATLDSFKMCDAQHAAIVNAWYAVGFGNAFVDHAVASFSADKLNFCNAPFTVNFKNSSVNGVDYTWNFGDGASSTLENPNHTYNEIGEYTVTLNIIGGDLCGTDNITRHSYIAARSLDVPEPQQKEVKIDKGASVNLVATSSEGSIYWYNDPQAMQVLHIGSNYKTPALKEAQVYYVKSVMDGNESQIGEDIESSLSVGQFSDVAMSMNFDIYQSLELQSITVNAKTSGIRIFTIFDKSGNMVFEKSVNLEPGVQNVELRVNLSTGNGYEIKVSGDDLNLWRSFNSNYPYTIPGVISIQGNSLNSETLYPYFYNWNVKEEDCTSGSETITVSIKEINPNPDQGPYNFYVKDADHFTYYVQYYFDEETTVNYRLFGINGQLMSEVSKNYKAQDPTPESVNELFDLDYKPSGVYFISIQGGKLEKTEKIVNKGGSN